MARVADKMLTTQPALRSLLDSLPAQLRVAIDRGLDAFEADLGLPPYVEDAPEQDSKPAKRKAAKR
jgi:hypothetical protein